MRAPTESVIAVVCRRRAVVISWESMTLKRSLFGLLMALPLFAGCGSSNDETRGQQKMDNMARERACQFSGGPDLAQRASFDLSCPINAIQCQVMQRAGMFAVAVQAGASGCGRRAMYFRGAGSGGAWLLNSAVQVDPQGAPPPPPPPPPGQPGY